MRAIDIYNEVYSMLGDNIATKAQVYNWLTHESRDLARMFGFPKRSIKVSTNECCELDFYMEKILSAKPVEGCKCKCHQHIEIMSMSMADSLHPNWNYDCNCPEVPDNLLIFDPAHDENKIWAVNACCDELELEILVRLPIIEEDEDLVWSVEDSEGVSKSHFQEYIYGILVPRVQHKNLVQSAIKYAGTAKHDQLHNSANIVLRGITEKMNEIEQKLVTVVTQDRWRGHHGRYGKNHRANSKRHG